MKLSEYAKQQGISYRTAFRWWQAGQIPSYQVATGTIIVQDPKAAVTVPQRVAIYARVSSREHLAKLEWQAEQLLSYCAAKGYQVSKLVNEIASGIIDSRPKWLALLDDQSMTLTVVEQKDRLTRAISICCSDMLLTGQGRALEVVNEAEHARDDLLADVTSIIHSFYARL